MGYISEFRYKYRFFSMINISIDWYLLIPRFHRLILAYKWVKLIAKHKYAKLEHDNELSNIHRSCFSNV